MKKLLSFNEYTTPKDLRKIYLMPNSDRFSFSHIDHLVRRVSENLFELILAPGIFVDAIDKDMPIYNYGNHDEIYELIRAGVSLDNIYNNPDNLAYANDKVKFHEAMSGESFVPKTVYNDKDVTKLKFPIIAKPKGGSKGEGIKVFKTEEEFKNREEPEDGKGFDLFCEKFDLDREFRVMTVRGKLAYMAERIPMNDKAKSLREGANIFASDDIFYRKSTLDGRSNYKWVEIENGDLPDKVMSQVNKIMPIACKKLGLDVIGLDLGLDTAGKIFLIEANTCPGLNKDQVVRLYLEIFRDFYEREPDAQSMKKIEQMREELVRANADVKFSHSSIMGRRMDWTYSENGRKTSNTKYDMEKSFGDTLKNIKNAKDKK